MASMSLRSIIIGGGKATGGAMIGRLFTSTGARIGKLITSGVGNGFASNGRASLISSRPTYL